MKCAFCGGDTEEQIVTFSCESQGKHVFVENVPAQACTRCGERTYSPQVTDHLLRFSKSEFEPVKTTQVPVFDFAQAG